MVAGNDGLPDSEIKKILGFRNIAVVGMSKSPEKAAHFVPKYLMDHGYKIVPVNPSAQEILGLKCYGSLHEVPGPIDIVDIFRPSERVPPIVEAASRKGVKAVWLQEGIHNEEAERKAVEHGMTVVWNRCMLKEHRRLVEGEKGPTAPAL